MCSSSAQAVFRRADEARSTARTRLTAAKGSAACRSLIRPGRRSRAPISGPYLGRHASASGSASLPNQLSCEGCNNEA